MLTKKFLLPVVLFVLILNAAAAFAQNRQTVFNLEEDVKQPAKIPDAVIAILKSEDRVDACFREKGEGANENDWFEASEIDLNGDRRIDLIVKAKDGCLFGANQGPFWIFQNLPDGFQQVLAASGLQLTVMPKKINSFHQIKINKIVSMKPASQIFQFVGGKYKAVR